MKEACLSRFIGLKIKVLKNKGMCTENCFQRRTKHTSFVRVHIF